MIFSSPDFVFGFLPFALIVFLVAKRLGGTWAIGAIVVLSSIFYSAWDIRFLPLLLGSVLFNYAIAQALDRVSGERTRALIYGAAVVINLAAICYFKYSNFALSNFAVLAGRSLTPIEVILPLGISFFTFQNIVYINGVWQRKYPAGRLLDYASCIVFFPHLIAGPIVLYQDLIHQFQAIRASRFPKPEYEVGGFIFVVGLFKKLVLADSLAPVADAVFSNTTNAPLLFQEAWFGALAYTFQIYFDFSGYSDMAIGLGLLFRRSAAAQLFLALQGHQHHRLLAYLAHDAVAFSARICLHTLGRQPAGTHAPLRQSDVDHVPGRPLARGRLDFRRRGAPCTEFICASTMAGVRSKRGGRASSRSVLSDGR